MSLLTKIFVVLTAVAALVYVPLTIAYVNNTNHITDLYQAERQRALVADESARVAAQQLDNLAAAHADELEQAEADKADLRGEIDDLMTQVSQRDVDITNVRNQLTSAQAQLEQLTAGAEQTAELLTMLETEVTQRREKWIEAQRQIAELTDSVQDKTTQLVTALEQIRLLRENLVDAEQQIADIRAQGGTAQAEEEGTVTPAGVTYPIRGRVTEVQERGQETTLVAVNVGSNDNVEEGMEFIVHDGTNYVGTIRIRRVDLNQAAGVVTQQKSGAQIRPNQQVTYADYQ